MPRLARKWGQWFALVGDLQTGACLLRRRQGDPSLLSPMRVFGREIIHKTRVSVNRKVTFGDLWLMLGLGSFYSLDVDSETMGKRRAIAAIEPIKSDTVLVADTEGRVDRKRPSSGLILAKSVRFQISTHREFFLIKSEGLASVAESCRNMPGCPNVTTPFLAKLLHLKSGPTLCEV